MKVFIISLLCLPALADILDVSFPLPLALRAAPTSTDGNCGSNSETQATCLTSTFGNCCSSKGYCGKVTDYCGEGCQPEFGTCLASTKGAQAISTSGSCGATKSANITCQGSEFGNCCSALGYCGGNSSYCADGCQSGFGTCGGAGETPSSSPTPVSLPLSTGTSSLSLISKPTGLSAASIDGNCGSNSATFSTCLGSTFGDCCSSLGYCGGNSSYCDAGCQSSYGTCGTSSNATSTLKPAGSPPATFLSAGAKAGIGLGAAALAIAAMGIIVWYVLRRRKSPRRGAVEMGAEDDADYGFQDKNAGILMQRPQTGTTGTNRSMVPLPSLGPQNRGTGSEPTVHELGMHEPVELGADNPYERKEKEMRRDWVDDRVAAGYDGAYRGN